MSENRLVDLQRQLEQSERRIKSVIAQIETYRKDKAKLEKLPYKSAELEEALATVETNIENTERRLVRSQDEINRQREKLEATKALEAKLAPYTDDEKKLLRQYTSIKLDH